MRANRLRRSILNKADIYSTGRACQPASSRTSACRGGAMCRSKHPTLRARGGKRCGHAGAVDSARPGPRCGAWGVRCPRPLGQIASRFAHMPTAPPAGRFACRGRTDRPCPRCAARARPLGSSPPRLSVGVGSPSFLVSEAKSLLGLWSCGARPGFRGLWADGGWLDELGDVAAHLRGEPPTSRPQSPGAWIHKSTALRRRLRFRLRNQLRLGEPPNGGVGRGGLPRPKPPPYNRRGATGLPAPGGQGWPRGRARSPRALRGEEPC
jgi:hypothetical protein